MKSRSFQILINVVSMLWCPLDWVSKIKTDSSGLTLTLLYYAAAATGFSAAAFTKTRFLQFMILRPHCRLAWILGNDSVTRGCPVDYLQDYQSDLKITLEQGKPITFLTLWLVDVGSVYPVEHIWGKGVNFNDFVKK